MERKLTGKQEKFVAAYLGVANGNASEAARIAGYAKPGQEGYRLLKNAEIASRVREKVAAVAATADEVLAELRDVAMADWRDFIEVLAYDKQGKPVKVRMDLSNKVKALELLGKYHQLFTENVQVSGTVTREYVVVKPDSP